MDIRTELGRRILFCDGAMGTMLQAAGLPAGREPELWNLERPEVVRALHGQYLAAGADIIATNTFGANGVKLSGHPLEEIVAAAVRLAREAVEEAGRWHLTPRGFLVSNQIIGGMLDALAADKQRRADAAARGDFRVNLD